MTHDGGSSRHNLRIGLVLLCALMLLAGYYLLHPTLLPETAAAGGLACGRVLIGLVILSLGGVTGRALGIAVEGNRAATVVLQASLGLGILAGCILIVGSTLGINLLTMGVLPLAVLLILRKKWLDWWRNLGTSLTEITCQAGRLEKCLALLIGLGLCSSLIIALAPPLKYDALMYHLVMPQTYIQAGKITGIPWLVMSGMPQGTEMLYTLAAFWGGLPAAAVMGWMIAVLAVLGIIGFFSSGFENGSRIGLAAAASLLAGETFVSSTSWAYVDWTGLLFGVCCLITLNAWLHSSQNKYLGCAGLFAGLGFTTKYTGGILALCALAVVILWQIRQTKSGRRFSMKPWLVFSGAAAAFPLVWLLRNLILTGNPFYPFFFPAAEMDAVRLAVYQGAEPYGEWWEAFLLPIRATLWGVESAEGYSVSIGALLLVLSLGNLLRRRVLSDAERNALHLGLVFFLSVWVFWGFGNRVSGYLIQTRMYYSIFPAFAIIAGLGWDAIRDIRWKNVRLSLLIGAVMLLALGLSVSNTILQMIRQDAPRMVAGFITEDAYLDANLGWYAPAVRAVNELPAGAKVLFLYEPRGLACTPICDPDEILDQWKINRIGRETGNSILMNWRQKGYNYLLVNKAGMQFLADGSDPHHPAAEIKALQSLLSEIPLIRSFGESYQIYQVP